MMTPNTILTLPLEMKFKPDRIIQISPLVSEIISKVGIYKQTEFISL